MAAAAARPTCISGGGTARRRGRGARPALARPLVIDPARLARILARLAPADRVFLEPRLLPGWLLRRRRLVLRDGLIREARRRLFTDRRATVAAKQLANALGAYALSGWRWERDLGLPAHASERHKTLHAILMANGGKVLGWRRVAEICGPARNGSAY